MASPPHDKRTKRSLSCLFSPQDFQFHRSRCVTPPGPYRPRVPPPELCQYGQQLVTSHSNTHQLSRGGLPLFFRLILDLIILLIRAPGRWGKGRPARSSVFVALRFLHTITTVLLFILAARCYAVLRLDRCFIPSTRLDFFSCSLLLVSCPFSRSVISCSHKFTRYFSLNWACLLPTHVAFITLNPLDICRQQFQLGFFMVLLYSTSISFFFLNT